MSIPLTWRAANEAAHAILTLSTTTNSDPQKILDILTGPVITCGTANDIQEALTRIQDIQGLLSHDTNRI